MKTTAMNAPTPAMVMRKVRIASSSEEYAFAMVDGSSFSGRCPTRRGS